MEWEDLDWYDTVLYLGSAVCVSVASVEYSRGVCGLKMASSVMMKRPALVMMLGRRALVQDQKAPEGHHHDNKVTGLVDRRRPLAIHVNGFVGSGACPAGTVV